MIVEHDRYIVVEKENLFYLMDEVNLLISKGWKVVGGVFVFQTHGYSQNYPTYFQAMEKDMRRKPEGYIG